MVGKPETHTFFFGGGGVGRGMEGGGLITEDLKDINGVHLPKMSARASSSIRWLIRPARNITRLITYKHQ